MADQPGEPPMRLNADFDQRIVVRPEDYEWMPSPVPGVTGMMLDRIGGEVARATSLVRYDPDSVFPAHRHDGGEEILVLEGEFADEHGHFGGEEILVLEGEFHDERGAYPAGSWIRNPHQSRHRPFTRGQGALIYVKTGHLMPAGLGAPGRPLRTPSPRRSSAWCRSSWRPRPARFRSHTAAIRRCRHS